MSTIVPNSVIQSQWQKSRYGGGETQTKEVLGAKSFFHWCCGMRMYRILEFERTSGKKIRRLGTGFPPCVGWYCPVCNERREWPPDW